MQTQKLELSTNVPTHRVHSSRTCLCLSFCVSYVHQLDDFRLSTNKSQSPFEDQVLFVESTVFRSSNLSLR